MISQIKNSSLSFGLKLATPKQMLTKATIVALPIIAMVSMSHAQTAEAGFGFFTWCMGVCTAATAGAFIPACVAACVASLAAPTP